MLSTAIGFPRLCPVVSDHVIPQLGWRSGNPALRIFSVTIGITNLARCNQKSYPRWVHVTSIGSKLLWSTGRVISVAGLKYLPRQTLPLVGSQWRRIAPKLASLRSLPTGQKRSTASFPRTMPDILHFLFESCDGSCRTTLALSLPDDRGRQFPSPSNLIVAHQLAEDGGHADGITGQFVARPVTDADTQVSLRQLETADWDYFVNASIYPRPAETSRQSCSPSRRSSAAATSRPCSKSCCHRGCARSAIRTRQSVASSDATPAR